MSFPKINEKYNSIKRPVKVIQFGTGNFLRAFADFYIQEMNDLKGFNGNIAVIKTTKEGSLEAFSEQNNLYTVLLQEEGVEQARVINSIDRVLDYYKDYDDFLILSEEKSLKFVISNTTEAGIKFSEEDSFEDLEGTFPAKLTKFLYKRFLSGGNGLYIIPCELIDNNGGELLNCVEKYIYLWGLPEDFKVWNRKENYYCNSLVDRIVTGFPKNSEEIYKKLNYSDNLITTAEPFGLWVIEKKGDIENELKGIDDIVFTDDVSLFKLRKVRILNGAHTTLVPIGILSGINTVKEATENKEIFDFLRKTLNEEIISTVPLDNEDLKKYADAVLTRFINPYIEHRLIDIALNSFSKFKVRVMPSIIGYINAFNKMPGKLLFSLACLIKMYIQGDKFDGLKYTLRDDIKVFDFIYKNKNSDINIFIKKIINEFFYELTKYEGLSEIITDFVIGINRREDVLRIVSEL